MKAKKSLTLLLALLMFTGTFASCGESTANADPSETTAGTQTEAPSAEETEAETEPEISDNLPEKDFEGYDYRMFVRDQGGRGISLIAEELTGDLLNDIVFNRNLAVADRFNINISFAYSADEYGTDCTPSILAGDDAYDLLAPHGRFAFEIALQGLTYEWNLLPYVNLDQPWWDKGARESFTIHDKLYTTSGDICYLSLGQTMCLLFNKNLFDEYQIAYPYQDVLEGTWTWDKWEDIINTTTVDLDGDGTINWENDHLGYATSVWGGLINMQFGGGISIVSVTNGEPEISFMTERTVEVFDRYFNLIEKGVNVDIDLGNAFRKGNVAFISAGVHNAVTYRDMEDDFGIIPFPKYTEDMEYRSCVEGGTNLFLVPITVSDLERSSIILEALASESYKNLIPQYYEIVLKTKHVRDPESSQIIDILRGSRVYDFGYYNMTIGLDSIPVNLYQTYGNGDNLVSFYQSKEKVAAKMLQKLMEKYDKIVEQQAALLP